jgi:hypothetical protein
VVAGTTVDSVVVLVGTVVVDVDVLVLVDVDVVDVGFVVVTPGPRTVNVVSACWVLGLVALMVAPPASEQFVPAGDEHAAGTLIVVDPEPVAMAMVLVRAPWIRST